MKIDRNRVHSKYDGHCAYCGKEITVKEMQVDHIIAQANTRPIAKDILGNYIYPDKHRIENLNPSCRRCNFYKSTFSLEEFRKQIKTLHQRIMNPFISKLGEQYGIIEVKEWDGKFYFEK